MDLNDLRIFRYVAKYGSMTKAANALNYVQSNVSARVQHLEKDLQIQLFYRHRSGITLAPAGKTLLDYANKINVLLDEAEKAVKPDVVPNGPLLIGAIESTAFARLPSILSEYHTQYPSVNISLFSDSTEALVSMILKREIDAAFVAGPVNHPHVVQQPLFTEELVFVAGPLHQPILSFADLYDTTLFLYKTGCFYRTKLDLWLQEEGIFPGNITYLGTLDNILNCVKANLGVSVMIKTFADEYTKNDIIKHYPIDKKDASVITSFIYHRDSVMTSSLKAFIDNLHKLKDAPIKMGNI